MPVYQYKGVHYDISDTDQGAALSKIKAHLGESDAPAKAPDKPSTLDKVKGEADFLGRETIRPILKGAADAVGFIPDIATEAANLVPESVLGPKEQLPSDYLKGKVDELIPKAKGASEGMETAAEMAPLIAAGGAGIAKGVSKLGSMAAREFSSELMPAAKKAWSEVRDHLSSLASTTKGKAEAERIASKQDIEGQHTTAVLDAHAKADAARAEQVQRARDTVKETHKEMDSLRGRIPNPEKDVPEARAAAGLKEPTNTGGHRLRADLAEIHAGELSSRENAKVYEVWDQKLDEMDKESPFATSPEGSDFMRYLDGVINPPPGTEVIKQSKRFERLASRVKAQITGKRYSQSRMTLGPYGDPIIETTETERPRFGKAINETLVELRNEQWSNYHKGHSAAANRFKGMADKLEASMKAWTKEEYPTDRWKKMSERLNQLNTPRVQRTLKQVGDEHLNPSKKQWGTDSSDIMKMWFHGPDSAAELKNAIGEEKFAKYAEEHLSDKIAGMDPKKITEFLKSEAANWVDQAPGLRNKAEKYAEELARRSGHREDIEAVIKSKKESLDKLATQVQAALKASPKARDTAIKDAGAVRDAALKGVEANHEAATKGADALSNFMIGKTPKVAVENFDKLAEKLQKSGRFSPQDIYSMRVKLEQAAAIQSETDRARAIRRWAYTVLGASAAGVEGVKLMGGKDEKRGE